jgi:nucleotide-binding universal stress UspA family protein
MSVACVPASEPLAATSIPRLRRVLATTDFSPLASRAIPLAYALVADGGVVHLVHAVVDPEELKNDPAGKLRAYIPPDAAARGIETKVEVLTVIDVALGICRAAEWLGVDALCMGTHGRTGLSRWVVGSVAQEVLRRTRRPVFLVPPERDD